MIYILAVVLAGLAAAFAGLWMELRRRLARSDAEQSKRMQGLVDERDEMEAALASMANAVLAVDDQGRLISFNDAAAALLELRREDHTALPAEQALTSRPLRRFIGQSLATLEPIYTDLELPGEHEPRMFEATASALRHRGGPRRGSLIVLHDVTRLRKLEVVRRDFVSNASHEIRTPVAAIKMAAETLHEEADQLDAQVRKRFLGIIARQADRLQSLIDDLLSLARIERDAEQRRVALDVRPVLAVLRSAAEACQTAASPRGSRIEIDCAPELSAAINAPLLEQAVTNLLDNAVKYSPDRVVVRCRAQGLDGEVVISVADPGVGIEPEHLPRVFERFYRTDKARSRELGGTGLGLAIVKHIAHAHGGRVSADSTVGKGSVFRIHLPAPAA